MGSKVSKPKSKKDKECLIQTCYDPKIEGGISSMEVSDDGSVIACGYDSGEIRLWSAKTAEVGCISQLEGHEDYITCLIMEEHILYSSSADGDIRKWDMQTSQCLLIFRPPAENGECRSTIIKIVSVGEFLFSASYDKTARCWDTENGELVKTFKGHKNSLSSLLFIPCEKENLNEAIQFVAQAAQEKNMTNPIDPAAKVVESLTQQHGKVDDECNVYSRDLIITGSMDRTARAWSIETGETVQIFRGHTNCVTCLAVDPLGKMLFTGSSDHTIRSWEIMTGQQLKVFTGHQTTVLYLLAHRKLLFSASSDNTVRCWVMEFGDCTRVYKGHTHSISYIMEHEGLGKKSIS